MKKKIYYSILFLFFIFIFSVFYLGLDKPNSYTPNEYSNKNLETFTSKELFLNDEFNSNDLKNQYGEWIVYDPEFNKKNNAIEFLNELGNPFEKILTDPDGTISIALGAYGVPETFLVNSKSKIIRKYIGPLKTENILEIIKIIK